MSGDVGRLTAMKVAVRFRRLYDNSREWSITVYKTESQSPVERTVVRERTNKTDLLHSSYTETKAYYRKRLKEAEEHVQNINMHT